MNDQTSLNLKINRNRVINLSLTTWNFSPYGDDAMNGNGDGKTRRKVISGASSPDLLSFCCECGGGGCVSLMPSLPLRKLLM